MGPKVKAVLILLAMYTMGIISGVAWDTYRSHHLTQLVLADRRIKRLKKELDLSPWQEQVLREIVQDAHDRAKDANDAVNFDLAQIHEDSLEAIQQLLTPEQQQRFDKFHKKYHARQHPKEETGDQTFPSGDESAGDAGTS